MTWEDVVRHDGRLCLGERSVRLVLAAVVFAVLVPAYFYPINGTPPFTTARFGGYASGWVTLLVPLAGLVLGYNAIAEDRESGAVRLSLSLPNSRQDLLFGTFLSRTGLLTAAILTGMALGGALVVYPFGELVLLPFLGYVLLTVLFGAVWTGLGVAVSSAVTTQRRAKALGFVLFAAFVLLWDTGVNAVRIGLERVGLTDGTLPDPVQFLVGSTPGNVYGRLVRGFVEPTGGVGGPWYLSEWVAVPLLVLWLVVPLGIANRRFDRSDLA
ncbi:ABC transporter permease [Halostella salina]|uniref:ABC transporter permease n=1 Tax=Halostella salina TaxID=1547897 RepID=UPI000EF7E647|nr:ABC transporter permease subunit [Halostella salina]